MQETDCFSRCQRIYKQRWITSVRLYFQNISSQIYIPQHLSSSTNVLFIKRDALLQVHCPSEHQLQTNINPKYIFKKAFHRRFAFSSMNVLFIKRDLLLQVHCPSEHQLQTNIPVCSSRRRCKDPKLIGSRIAQDWQVPMH